MALRETYWRVNGHAHVRNGLYQLWYARGYAAQKNSHIVNWAKALATTTAEFGCCKSNNGLEKTKAIHTNDGMERSKDDGIGTYSAFIKSKKSYGQIFSEDQVLNIVDKAELGKVQEFLDLKVDLWKYAKAKARALEDQKKELYTEVSKPRAALEDQKMQVTEDAKSLLVADSFLKDITMTEEALKNKVLC